MSKLCGWKTCTDPATRTYAVDGTNRTKPVCDDNLHRSFVKNDLAADHPGFTITETRPADYPIDHDSDDYGY